MRHELEEVYTGFPKASWRPSFGSVVSKFRGGDSKLPSYVSLDYATTTLGIDYKQTVPDFTSRPMQLLDHGDPIAELVE